MNCPVGHSDLQKQGPNWKNGQYYRRMVTKGKKAFKAGARSSILFAICIVPNGNGPYFW